MFDEDGETALEGVSVNINGDSYKNSTLTDIDGYFNFVDLKAGDYTLTFEREGYTTHTESVTLGEGEAYDIEVIMGSSFGSIFGYVASNEEPVERAKVKLKKVGKVPETKTTYTDEAGYYEFSDLEEGDYYVVARKKGYYRTKVLVELEEGEDAQIDLELEEK